MTHISIDRNGKSYHVPEANVSDLMSLLDQQFEASRLDLIKDLDDIQATAGEKIVALKELRAAKGLTSNLMRSAFELEGATNIIKYVCDPKDVDSVLDATPDDIVWLALKILGFEPSDPSDEDEEEASEEGKPSSQGTST